VTSARFRTRSAFLGWNSEDYPLGCSGPRIQHIGAAFTRLACSRLLTSLFMPTQTGSFELIRGDSLLSPIHRTQNATSRIESWRKMDGITMWADRAGDKFHRSKVTDCPGPQPPQGQRVSIIVMPLRDEPDPDLLLYDGERRWRAILKAIVVRTIGDAELSEVLQSRALRARD
jgi:hypothetical protein